MSALIYSTFLVMTVQQFCLIASQSVLNMGQKYGKSLVDLKFTISEWLNEFEGAFEKAVVDMISCMPNLKNV
jgi:hypothetical protein